MSLAISPPMQEWRLGAAASEAIQARRELLVGATHLDGTRFEGDVHGPIIATGHQAWLWHPGILAKLFAVDVAARLHRATAVHLVVNHDAHAALKLDVPVWIGGGRERLGVRTFSLAEEDPAVPTGRRRVDRLDVVRRLRHAKAELGDAAAMDLGPLLKATQAAADTFEGRPTPAAFVTAVQSHWLTAHGFDLTHHVVAVDSDRLLQTSSARHLLQRMLHEARPCAAAYNRAVAAHPEAGVAPLMIERERVEMPLWALAWNRPRRRVFADLADSRPAWTDEAGELLTFDGDDERAFDSAPRALLLSALMRLLYSDLFVHGTGGGVYDRATEAWWHEWIGDELAPMATATANLRPYLDATTATPADVARAVWYRHHLPHNVDRHAPLMLADTNALGAKREALDHMDHDRDPRRRWALFRRLHKANAALQEHHPEALREAEQAVDRARIGVSNHAIARRRDWCFMLYPPDQIEALRVAIERPANV